MISIRITDHNFHEDVRSFYSLMLLAIRLQLSNGTITVRWPLTRRYVSTNATAIASTALPNALNPPGRQSSQQHAGDRAFRTHCLLHGHSRVSSSHVWSRSCARSVALCQRNKDKPSIGSGDIAYRSSLSRTAILPPAGQTLRWKKLIFRTAIVRNLCSDNCCRPCNWNRRLAMKWRRSCAGSILLAVLLRPWILFQLQKKPGL
jgi:hypothetical protein